MRTYARPYTIEDGALRGVTYFLLPFRPALADLETMELERAEPQFMYRHKDGRQQVDEPSELKAERERIDKARRQVLDKARAMKTTPNAGKLAALVVKSDWERVKVWGLLHDTFCICFLLVVAIDFPDPQPSAEARILADFWAHKPAKVLERWVLFQQMTGINVINTLWDAFGATRDETASAPPELGQAAPPTDPLP